MRSRAAPVLFTLAICVCVIGLTLPTSTTLINQDDSTITGLTTPADIGGPLSKIPNELVLSVNAGNDSPPLQSAVNCNACHAKKNNRESAAIAKNPETVVSMVNIGYQPSARQGAKHFG